MPEATMPTLEAMLEAGVHFGHQTRQWNPKMKKYIFDAREGVHIIDLEKTYAQLEMALDFIVKNVTPESRVVLVGTKRQASPIVKAVAQANALHYVVNRWPGGLITNFSQLIDPINGFAELIQITNDETKLGAMSAKQKFQTLKERDRRAKVFEGLVGMEKYPDLLIVVDPRREHTAIHEAHLLGVPTIAIVDTNTDPGTVEFPIPANDDAIRSIGLILQALATTVSQTIKTKTNAAVAGKKVSTKDSPKINK